MTYQEAGDILLKRHNVSIRKVRQAMTGRAYIKDREISTPLPRTAKSFEVFCHEVGHIVNGNIKPSCLGEYQASMFAIACFKEFGFAISREVKNRINRYIAYSLAQALNRGMKKIPVVLRPYKKLLYKCSGTGSGVRVKNGVETPFSYHVTRYITR